MRYTLRNIPAFVGNTCTNVGGDVSQNQLHAGFTQVSSQAENRANAYGHPNLPFHSSQPVVTVSSQPTAAQALDVSYIAGNNVGGVNAGFGLNTGASANVGFSAGTGVNVGFGGVSANAGFNVGGSGSGIASLATAQTAQVNQELTQSAIQRTTQTTAGLDIATGNESGQATLVGSSVQYDAGVVSGQVQGQATQITTLSGSEDIQLGSVVKGRVGSGIMQGVGRVATTDLSGQYSAGFISGQMQGQASGVASLGGSEGVQLGTVVTNQVASNSTQAVGQASSVQQTTQGKAEQASVVSGQMRGQATQITTLSGSEDVQLGSVIKGQVGSGIMQGVGQVATTDLSGQYSAGFISGQMQGQASGVASLGGREGVQLGTVVTNQVAANSTQAVGQASSVQQTTQGTAEQASQVTAVQNTQETTQSSIQAQVSKDTAQSSIQETTQTATELNAQSANTSGLVNVAGSLGQYVGGSATVGLGGLTLGFSAGASANVGLGAAVSSGQSVQVTTDQLTQQTIEAVTQQNAHTNKIDGMTKRKGCRRVAWESTREVDQSSSVKQTTKSTSDQIAQASTDVTAHSSAEQTSTELDIGTGNKDGLITVTESSTHCGGHVDQKQSSLQQIAQVSTEETTQSSAQQMTEASAELDVRKQTQGEEFVDVTIIHGGKAGSETHLEGWESTHGAGESSSTQQTSPSMSRQVSQMSMLSTQTSEFEEISMEHGVRTGNTSGIVTIAGSSEQYDGGASVQTQEVTVGAAIVQGGADVHGECVTGQVSTQGVIQSSSVL